MLTDTLLLFSSIGFTLLLGVPTIASASFSEKKLRMCSSSQNVNFSTHIINVFDESIWAFMVIALCYLVGCILLLVDTGIDVNSVIQPFISAVTFIVLMVVVILLLTAKIDHRIAKGVKMSQLLNSEDIE